ncbi:MAG: N-acetyl-gamma-glutamyl-phosphate reductase [Cyclobacteriaceae bacterium]
MRKKQIAIIGATGFTGSELVRILRYHPNAEISVITSESRKGELFSDVHPFFEGIADMTLDSVENIGEYDIDLAFLALPHGVSMNFASLFHEQNIPVVDLSGDFRLSSPEVYKEWYGKEHTWQDGFSHATYGIPELFRENVHGSRLVANPGCYPTSVILGAAPLLREGMADGSRIIADSKSGVTGAGVKSKPVNHFSSVNDNFKAYGISNHRHSIEIQEKMDEISGKQNSVQFTPHLLPVDRGILSTIYLQPADDQMNIKKLSDLYADYYAKEPFIRLLKASPSIKAVRGTNFCDIYTTFDERTGNIIVVSAIDNLVKGAAGQAVQNMNLMFNWEETAGLQQIPLSP